MSGLKGKIALVTGAAMGNGFGIAKVLAEKGAIVNLLDISEQVFSAAAELTAAGGTALTLAKSVISPWWG